MVRAADKKSPREAVEFVLQLLKYNDNNGNPYSDVFWLAALVQSVGELEFGQQSILFLSSLLKRIDRLLQFDRLMPSYNGILTISCIRTLTQIGLKLSGFIPLDRVIELVKPFRDFQAIWQVRIEASRALLGLEFHFKGIDAALSLFIKYVEEEPSIRGQVKLGVHAMRLCQIKGGSESDNDIKSSTLVALLRLLESRIAFNNVFLRHHLFCILRILAGRLPTLYGVPRDQILQMDHAEICSEQKNGFITIVKETKSLEPPVDTPNVSHDGLALPEASREADTVSNSHERKMPVVKIRVRQSAASSRAEEADNPTVDKSQGGHNETDRGGSSSISVDAPQRNFTEAVSISNQNLEEVNSCHDRGSRMTASIGSAKLASDGDEVGKELQCTADSGKISVLPPSDEGPLFSGIQDIQGGSIQDNIVDVDAQKYASLQTLSVMRHEVEGGTVAAVKPQSHGKAKEKKEKEKKRKREDPEYLERKRLKKEKKQKEKEMAQLLSGEAKQKEKEMSELLSGEAKQKEKEMTELLSGDAKASSVELGVKKVESGIKLATVQYKASESSVSKIVTTKVEASEGSSAPKFRIKIKNRSK